MSKKIIGVTVGTALPKPNFDQTDPKKGDYIKGDRSFLNAIKTINGVGPDSNGDFVIAVDDTLTQAGVAADAKVVGESIETVNNLVGDVPVATQIADAITAIPQADWNQNDENAPDYVKNRTHYSGLQHITFTGDTDGLDVYNGYLYRVHSDTPNINDVIGGTMTVLVDGSYRDFTITESWVKQLTAYPNDGYVINNSVIVFFNDVPNVAKAGIYFAWHQAICQVAGLSYNVRKTLDEKYIPDTIARKSDIPDAIAVDPTLTIEGAAADAKATGDAIGAVSELVGDVAVATQITEAIASIPQADWNQNDENAPDYVKNRTHYDEYVHIDWDGITENRQIIKSTGTLATFRFIKMSEMTPSHELLVANTAKITISKVDRYGTLLPEKVININSGNVIVGDKGWSHIEDNNGHGIVVVYEAGYEYTCTRSGLSGIYTFTEPGIYFTFYYNRNTVSGACTQIEWEALVPLDEKYIPSTIARVSDIPDAIVVDPTLTIEGAAADAKVVGDLWNNIPTDADVWETLINIGLYERLADESGNVLTDEANAILLI
jgi:hypothetical protein